MKQKNNDFESLELLLKECGVSISKHYRERIISLSGKVIVAKESILIQIKDHHFEIFADDKKDIQVDYYGKGRE